MKSLIKITLVMVLILLPNSNSLANLQIYMSLCKKFKKLGMEEYFECKNIQEIYEKINKP